MTSLFSVENLAFVICLILASYYLWGVYNSFTHKYLELAILVSNYHDQLTNHDITQRKKQRKTGIIPKELFNMVCEELMPIRENTRERVFKAMLHLIFLFDVFTLVVLSDGTPLTKCFLSSLAGLLPGLITFYFDRRKQINFYTPLNKERVREIIETYNKSTLNYLTQGQRHIDATVVSILSLKEKIFPEEGDGTDIICVGSAVHISVGIIALYCYFS